MQYTSLRFCIIPPHSPRGNGDESTQHTVVGRRDVNVTKAQVRYGDRCDARKTARDGSVNPDR